VAGGALLTVTSWRGLFVALSVIGCLLLAASAWALRESLPREARHSGGLRETGRQFGTVLRDVRFLGFTAVLALGSCSLFTYISMSPFVLQDGYGLSAQAFSYVFAANSVALVLTGQLSATLVGRQGAHGTLVIGLGAGAVSGTGLLVATLLDASLPVVLPILLLAIATVALIMPSATALAMDQHGPRAGTASGVIGLSQFGLGGVVAPIVSLAGTSAVLMAVTMTVASGLALVVGVALVRQRPGRDSHLMTEPALPDRGTLPDVVDEPRG